MKLFLAFICIAYATADHLDNTYLPPINAQSAGGNGNFLGAPFQPQSNTYLPPRPNNSHYASRPVNQFNGNDNYMKSHPAFNQIVGPKYGASNAKYGTQFTGAKVSYDAPVGIFNKGKYNGNSVHGSHGYNRNAQGFSSAEQSVDGGAAILKFENNNNGDGSYNFEYETENNIKHQEVGSLRAASEDEDTIAVQGSYSYTGPNGIVYTVNYIADENGFQAYGDHLPTPPSVPEVILKSIEQNTAEEAAQNKEGYSSGIFSGKIGLIDAHKQQQQYNFNQQYQGQLLNGNKLPEQSFNAQQSYKY